MIFFSSKLKNLIVFSVWSFQKYKSIGIILIPYVMATRVTVLDLLKSFDKKN